ncbi:MAG: FMN-binding protein [Pirellulales bacterium]|nr:FMN-binding protein [Pirellulales bacterium]
MVAFHRTTPTLILLAMASLSNADTVEFLSGAKISGKVKEIRKSDKEFDFEAKVGARTIVRTYAFNKVHAVTMSGKRFTLTPLPKSSAATKVDAQGNVLRSKREVDQIIKEVGSSMPDWFDSTPLNYPDTLDLDWPLKPPTKGWNNKKNMGQYIWDIINPNPSRWHSGIKLVHHCMTLHEGKSSLLKRDMKTVGRMYFELLQDYPRAAYWLQRGGAVKGEPAGVMLAECYWRLGNRQMAMQQLVTRTYAGGAAQTIKLYGNMGALNEALQLTDLMARSGQAAYQGYIAAGDALRQAGQFDRAIDYYNKVLSATGYRNKEYENRFKARARESIQAIELFEQVDVSSMADGKYRESSTGYNGQVNVEVAVAGGKIESVKVTQHREKQFYSAFTDTEKQILDRQSVRGVDGTSGATITSRAIVNAAAKALAGASR